MNEVYKLGKICLLCVQTFFKENRETPHWVEYINVSNTNY